ncbi:MCT family MFS transporter [Aspergillus candidus]|uniref:Monocarboxylate transporter n=1 Tax=Aspergillus candidus TaxID=41067 RepID=A0A2I2FGL9_ASPCN|nr:monocarboxylate transporter [Aspergillus candidus]PLB39762.1 monocarboxylate transporter [Aspergillus candidus]
MEAPKNPQTTISPLEVDESSVGVGPSTSPFRDTPHDGGVHTSITTIHSVADPPASHERSTDTAESFPDGGYRSWLVVMGSFLLLMSSYGLMNSVGVLQSYLENHQLSDYSSQNVGWISGLFVFMSLGLGVLVGPMFDTYGPRELVMSGSVFYAASLFLTAECTRYWHFILCFGIMAGIGGALTSTVGMSCVPHWFQARAGMALGTAMAGAGLGGVIFPFILKGAFASLGFKWGMRILAFVVLVLSGLGSFLVKSRLPKGQLKAAIDIRCFRDSRFTWLSAAIFTLELEVFALIGLYPTYVAKQGFSTSASVYTLVVLNVCSCIGRLLAGRIADRYGRLNVLIILISAAVITIFVILYPFSHHLPALYLFSALYGLFSGSFISLAPVCIRQVSHAKEIGMRFGTCYCLVSFATLICIPIGGEVLEKVGSRIVVVWLGCVLLLSTLLFLTARWACLDYKWHWRIKI